MQGNALPSTVIKLQAWRCEKAKQGSSDAPLGETVLSATKIMTQDTTAHVI